MSSQSGMTHRALFRCVTRHAGVICAALAPETDPAGRSVVKIECEDDHTLVLRAFGADLSALRAALNSWLRLVMIAEEMQEIVHNE